jgi:DNA-binding GntR family transcriptional regulator
MRQEVLRLWNMSAYYRLLYLLVADETTHLHAEHRALIDAVRAQDSKLLILESDRHRSGTEQVATKLPRRRHGL